MFLYEELYNKMSKGVRFNLRAKMIEKYYKGKGVSQISSEQLVSRNIFKKWIKRKIKKWPKELSERPHNSPNRAPKEILKEILELYKKPNWKKNLL